MVPTRRRLLVILRAGDFTCSQLTAISRPLNYELFLRGRLKPEDPSELITDITPGERIYVLKTLKRMISNGRIRRRGMKVVDGYNHDLHRYMGRGRRAHLYRLAGVGRREADRVVQRGLHLD